MGRSTPVAAKLVTRQSPRELRRFAHEIGILKSLRHTNIVQVIPAFESNSSFDHMQCHSLLNIFQVTPVPGHLAPLFTSIASVTDSEKSVISPASKQRCCHCSHNRVGFQASVCCSSWGLFWRAARWCW